MYVLLQYHLVEVLLHHLKLAQSKGRSTGHHFQDTDHWKWAHAHNHEKSIQILGLCWHLFVKHFSSLIMHPLAKVCVESYVFCMEKDLYAVHIPIRGVFLYVVCMQIFTNKFFAAQFPLLSCTIPTTIPDAWNPIECGYCTGRCSCQLLFTMTKCQNTIMTMMSFAL